MGWYKSVIAKLASSYEAKVVKIDAERIARRRLFFKGNTSPNPDYIQNIVKEVVSKLETQYGSLDKIRRASNSENLDSIIEKAVVEILPWNNQKMASALYKKGGNRCQSQTLKINYIIQTLGQSKLD